MNGYMGKILRVNLTERRYSVESIPEPWRAAFIGGRGLAMRYYAAEVAPSKDMGMELRFGDGEKLLRAIDSLASRKDLPPCPGVWPPGRRSGRSPA